MDVDSDASTFEVDCLVTIIGLQSQAGKALNGSSAFITGPPTNEGRYPVMLYGTRNNKPMNPPLQRSIKAQNIQRRTTQKHQLYKKCVRQQSEAGFRAGNFPLAELWLRGYSEKYPEDFLANINFANMLLQLHKIPGTYRTEKEFAVKASAIFRRSLVFIPEGDQHRIGLLNNICMTMTDADECPHEALRYAQMIPTNTPEGLKRSNKVLNDIRLHFRDKTSRECIPFGDEEKRNFQTMYELTSLVISRDPENRDYLISHAASACLIGKNLEGVQYYRAGLEKYSNEEKKNDPELHQIIRDLIVAQMQCPGGPMENYRILGHTVENGKKKWICVHTSQDDYYNYAKIHHDPGNPIDCTGYLQCKKAGLKLELFDIPDDPDDWSAYGGAFEEV